MGKLILEYILFSLIPVVLSIIFFLLSKYTKFGKLNNFYKNILIGLFFSAGLIVNVFVSINTSSVLISPIEIYPIFVGLVFNGPLGLIIGVIGGLFRYFSSLWNPSFASLRFVYLITCLFSGLFILFIKKFVLNNKRGEWYHGLFSVLTIENLFMILIFVADFRTTKSAFNIAEEIYFPIIIGSIVSVVVCLFVIALFAKEKVFYLPEKLKLTTKIQISLFSSLLVAYGLVSGFAFLSVYDNAKTSIDQELVTSKNDLKNDVYRKVNDYMSEKVIEAAEYTDTFIWFCTDFSEAYDISDLKEEVDVIRGSLGLSELNIVGKDNYIKYSTAGYDNPPFNMGDPNNKQAYEFTCLNNGTEIYIQDLCEPSSAQGKNIRVKYAGHVLDKNDYGLGYVQIALYEEPYHKLIDEHINGCASFRRIGNNGFLMVTDRDGKNVSSSTNAPKISKIEIPFSKDDTSFEYSLNVDGVSTNYFVSCTDVEDYRVFAFAEVNEMMLSSRITVFCITLVQIFIFFIVYYIIFIALRKSVTNRIENIDNGLQSISDGNFDVKINERNSIEMEGLSNNINKTVNSLKEYAEREIKRNEEEMKFANTIQLSVLPKDFPINEKFEIFASMNTAKAVGGDFYDFFYIDPDNIAIEIADVSGKGVPAALFMMQAKSVVKKLLESGVPLKEAADQINKFLCENNEAKMFVTVWLAIINLTNGQIKCINAGHNKPLIIRSDGSVEFLNSSPDLPFGCFKGSSYQVQNFDLKQGDKIYLYTDGVTEAMNKDKKLFGNDRLLSSAIDNHYENCQLFCESILKSVEDYVKEEEQSDDITMLCFNFKEPEVGESIVVDAKLENLYTVIDYINDLLQKHECTNVAKTQINITIDELFSNICLYAYKNGENGKIKVIVDFYDENHVSITFEDNGIPYNPIKKKDLDINTPLKERKVGGAGIFIVKNFMDSMEYKNANGYNVLKIKKTIK